ncbi:MmcQ-like protein [Paenibacillus sp. PK3_47]|uniref:MmcQ/YjbR family DNA-binding protein n=1 Tax=Paenibacillus sp. PK3_47 TaxID=2072642 RepID=UPI00201D39CB|nr:MmcQ/YjbR family DNA-binding protein [Paenibacillus sp. PK3_47]UQZ35882.1 MmcQ-like protein [Paenibacillus sp. PK3_47]
MKNTVEEYCLSKKGAGKEYPFGPDPAVFKVGGKMFGLLFQEHGADPRLNLKCDPVIAENLREQNRDILPGYHMNKKHWNTILLNGSLSEPDVFDMIDHSYDLVVKSLPKRLRDELIG